VEQTSSVGLGSGFKCFLMRTRSASAVVAIVAESPEKKRLTLRKRRVDTREEEGDIIDAVAREESALLREEKVWLHGRLVVALEKTRSVLAVVKDDSLADNVVFEEILQLQSLDEVLAVLNGNNNSIKKKREEENIGAQMFRCLFNDEEWTELEESEQAIAAADEAKLRLLRLQRQRKLLWETRNVAIELTVRDEDVAGEQTALVNECMQVMNVVLDRIGMNGRGTVRRVVPAVPAVAVAVASIVKQKKSKEKRVAVKLTGMGKSKQSKKVKEKKVKEKKREERSQEAEDMEEEEEEGELEVGRKRAKTSSECVEDDEDENEEEEEEEGADEDNRIDIDELLEEAKLDVDIVVNMLKERNNGDGLLLKVAKINIPDPICAGADAGSAVLLDDVKLSQCLVDDYFVGGRLDGDCLALERWGTLLKWWRLMNRAFAIAGIFASLRARKKRKGVTLKDCYVEAVKRLQHKQGKGGDKLYSYAQAAIYDRLGRFLLKYPRFVYQLQLFSLKDWYQNVSDGDNGDDGKLIDALEASLVVDEEKSAFWVQ
jgi:hypothetical protein